MDATVASEVQSVSYDWVAPTLGALFAGIISLGTFWMQFISWKDARKARLAQEALKEAQDRIKEASEIRDIKLDHLTNLATKTSKAVDAIGDKQDVLAIKADIQDSIATVDTQPIGNNDGDSK